MIGNFVFNSKINDIGPEVLYMFIIAFYWEIQKWKKNYMCTKVVVVQHINIFKYFFNKRAHIVEGIPLSKLLGDISLNYKSRALPVDASWIYIALLVTTSGGIGNFWGTPVSQYSIFKLIEEAKTYSYRFFSFNPVV